MLVYTPFALCFVTLRDIFYAFSGTNLLTRCHSVSPCFLLFLCFIKATQKIFLELDETKDKPSIFPEASRSPKMRWRGARGSAHPRKARPTPSPCHQGVRPPGPPPDAALSPIYSPRREKPKGRIAFPRNILQATAVVVARSGGSRSSSRHPVGEGNPYRRPSPPPWSPPE
jgi:hypothetical protein